MSDSFWWGNEKLAQALNDGRQYELRIDLFDWEGEHRYAKYSHFHVAPESDNYRLNISGYTGNAGRESFRLWQNHQQFTTVDRDNDALSSGNCAAQYGGFWWFRCGAFTPNGRYSCTSSVPTWTGLHWAYWRGGHYSLKAVSIAFRAIESFTEAHRSVLVKAVKRAPNKSRNAAKTGNQRNLRAVFRPKPNPKTDSIVALDSSAPPGPKTG